MGEARERRGERERVRERAERQSIRRSRRRHEYYEQLQRQQERSVVTSPCPPRAGESCLRVAGWCVARRCF